jgi:hypothetical protein
MSGAPFRARRLRTQNPGLKPWAMVYSRFAAESDRHPCYDVHRFAVNSAAPRFLVAAAPIPKEILKKLAAFVFTDTGGN